MAMYAQVVQGGTTLAKRAEMDRIVIEEMIPALQQERGFRDAMNLVDRDTGNGMMIIVWETKEQAERPLSEYGPAFLKALADITAISTGNREPISTWEVNAKS
jgi:hypothetical protein